MSRAKYSAVLVSYLLLYLWPAGPVPQFPLSQK